MTISPYREDTSAVGLPGNLSPVGLALPEGLTFAEWEHVGTTLKTIRDSALRWWWGDWLNYGEHHYGERYAQAVEGSDYTYGSLRVAAFVCRQIPLLRRRNNLSFSHHQEVASLPTEDEREVWLEDTEANGWSVHTLRSMIAQTKQQPTPHREFFNNPATHSPQLIAALNDSRSIDTDTGEVFSGGDWTALSPSEPIPFDLRSAIVGGEVGEHTGVARWHAVTTHLYRAAREAQPLLVGWEPRDLAGALSIEEAAGLHAIGPLVEFVSAVVAARQSSQQVRRIK